MHLPSGTPPSSVQRVWLWRAASEAVASSPLVGYGAGTAVSVLTRQEAFSEFYLAIPSYAEHAHHELLEALLDGGLINLLLLAGLLATTLAPLWRRREEVPAFALRLAWSMLLVHALLDVQLSQPGPLLLLALLAGVSWALPSEGQETSSAARALPLTRAARVLLQSAGLALSAYVALEVAGSAGTVPELQKRLDDACKDSDRAGSARLVGAFISLVGPLDDLYYQRAHLTFAPPPPGTTRSVDAEDAILGQATSDALAQARLLPVLPQNLELMARLERRCRQLGEPAEAEQLRDAQRIAQARARIAEARVPENAKSRDFRARLDRVLLRSMQAVPQQGVGSSRSEPAEATPASAAAVQAAPPATGADAPAR